MASNRVTRGKFSQRMGKRHCTGKQKFQSEALAESFMNDANVKSGFSGRAYKCNECPWWHWGYISRKTRIE